MVAVCDPKYDISAYLHEHEELSRRQLTQQPRQQSVRGVCTAAECRQSDLAFGAVVDWKCEALELLDAAIEDTSMDWHKLYDAMQRAFSPSVAVKDKPALERKFAALAEQWRVETAALSSVEMFALHPAYQRIIGMGLDAVPLILSEMSREPGHWFWALSAITGENPVKPEDAGDLTRMTEAWLQLGRKRGWI